jgi:hypothetical protein|tara:strand:+ start:822 stop:1004 length:183 start_codon:yes stop_codon:yes gene_type:complete
MKTKKPNASGYAFANMFKNINDDHKWVARLKKIAKEQHRSVSAQARVFLMKAIVEYESKK